MIRYRGIKKYGVLVSLVFLISGCSPHRIAFEKEPNVENSQVFSISSDTQKEETPWWNTFAEPKLNELIEQSFQSNQTLIQALSRVRQAQSLTTQTKSGLYPQLNIAGEASDRWEGSDEQKVNTEIGGFLEWEVDVFNRLSAGVKADKYTEIARREDVKALRLSLSAEIATAYFGAVAANQRIALLNEQVRTDEELLELLQLRLDNGIGTNVEVFQQQSRVAESESLIPPTEADLRLFENRLDVLTGQMPDAQNRVSKERELSIAETLPFVGVPSDLLLNRPDLRAAKAELIAQDAEIAVAIADRLPRITLQGAYIYSDTASFAGPVGTLLGSFVQPLIDWGQRKAEVERNKALYEEELAAFTQLYLEAVEDVENALYQENRQREFIKRLEQRRDLLNKTVEETEARYKQGIDDYLPVLNALQELRSVERDLVSERLTLVLNRINLHRALGGRLTSSMPLQEINEKEQS